MHEGNSSSRETVDSEKGLLYVEPQHVVSAFLEHFFLCQNIGAILNRLFLPVTVAFKQGQNLGWLMPGALVDFRMWNTRGEAGERIGFQIFTDKIRSAARFGDKGDS